MALYDPLRRKRDEVDPRQYAALMGMLPRELYINNPTRNAMLRGVGMEAGGAPTPPPVGSSRGGGLVPQVPGVNAPVGGGMGPGIAQGAQGGGPTPPESREATTQRSMRMPGAAGPIRTPLLQPNFLSEMIEKPGQMGGGVTLLPRELSKKEQNIQAAFSMVGEVLGFARAARQRQEEAEDKAKKAKKKDTLLSELLGVGPKKRERPEGEDDEKWWNILFGR